MANPLFMGGPTAQPVDSADTGYIEATYDPATKTFYGDAGGSIGWGPITNQGEIDKLKQKNKDKLVKIESDHTVAVKARKEAAEKAAKDARESAKLDIMSKLGNISTPRKAPNETTCWRYPLPDPASGEGGLGASDDYVMFRFFNYCLLYTSPSPRDQRGSRMPSSA